MAGEQESREAPTAHLDAAQRPPATRGFLAGGVEGNSLLSTAAGALLLVLLVALGVTMVAIHSLIDEHLFIGMLLIGPLALKLASVGYRFARFRAGDPSYRERGAPDVVLATLAPLLVSTTLIVFASGVVLLLAGPGSRGLWKPIHDYSFGVWLAVWCGHFVLHLLDLPKLWTGRQSERPWDDRGSGRGGRALALTGALVLGVVLALLSVPLFAAWSHWLNPVAR